MWPEYFLHIPLHLIVYLNCLGCASSFSLIAADLVLVCDGGEGYVPAVVNQLVGLAISQADAVSFS
jgi:hypothetical protein